MLEITIIFDWISSGVAVPKDIKKIVDPLDILEVFHDPYNPK